jgi:membrane-bound lytic murein transglycosylase B
MMLRARAGKLSNRDRVLRGARLALLGCSLGFLSIGHAGDYSDHAALQSVIDAAQKEGVDADWSRNLIGEAQRQQSILDAIARPAEKTKPWYEYRQIFLTERRVREGVAFWDAHADTLRTVGDRTGVPPEIMVAIIGVETYYGRITGSYRVIDALATLAFDYPRRAPFFTRELEQFLILAWESDKDPLALKGSYAGAMGFGQFMPSSYRAYARSYEGAAAPDIWDNPADAISSVGSYLAAHGWRRDDAVVVDAVSNNADPTLFEAGLKPSQLAGDLPAMGLEPVDAVDPAIEVTPLRLEEETQLRYWLGLQNFYVITRYNHSAMYAMAVWELSQAIAAARATL